MGSNGTAPSNGGAPRADSAAAGLASTGSAQPNSVAVQAQQQQQQAATGGGYRFDRQALVEEQRRKQEVYAAAQALVDRIIKPLAMDVKLHELKRRTRDLGELGITSEQVEDVVSRTGMGPASLNSLRNLVVTAQVQRRGISAAQQQQQQLLQPGSAARLNAPATAAPLAAVQQAMQQQQQPPPQPLQQLRQQEHQQQPAAAAAAASRRPAPGWGQPGRGAGAASSLSTGGAAATQAAQQEPSSSEVDDDEASSGSRNRTPGSKSSIRDLLNEERIWLPSYAPGSYNHQLCPACQGGSSGEKSLSVTVEEGGQAAVWNCFRAKCGWAGGVSLAKQQRGGRQKQQYTNDQGRRGGAGRGRAAGPPVELLVAACRSSSMPMTKMGGAGRGGQPGHQCCCSGWRPRGTQRRCPAVLTSSCSLSSPAPVLMSWEGGQVRVLLSPPAPAAFGLLCERWRGGVAGHSCLPAGSELCRVCGDLPAQEEGRGPRQAAAQAGGALRCGG